MNTGVVHVTISWPQVGPISWPLEFDSCGYAWNGLEHLGWTSLAR